MAGHIVRALISQDNITLRFECVDPKTCEVRADDGKCWPVWYAGQDGRIEEFIDADAPEVPLVDGAPVEIEVGIGVDEWSWRMVPRAHDGGDNDER